MATKLATLKKLSAVQRANSDLAQELAEDSEAISKKFGASGDYIDAGELQRIAKRLFKIHEKANSRANNYSYQMENREEKSEQLNGAYIPGGSKISK